MSDIVSNTIGECWLKSISEVMKNGKQCYAKSSFYIFGSNL